MKDKETMTIQQSLETLANAIRRDDFSIAVLLSPRKRPTYAIRLGLAQDGGCWIKDIDLPTVLRDLALNDEDRNDKAAKAQQAAEQKKNEVQFWSQATLWASTKAPENPPF